MIGVVATALVAAAVAPHQLRDSAAAESVPVAGPPQPAAVTDALSFTGSIGDLSDRAGRVESASRSRTFIAQFLSVTATTGGQEPAGTAVDQAASAGPGRAQSPAQNPTATSTARSEPTQQPPAPPPEPAPPPAYVLPAQGRYTSCFCERWGEWHGGLDIANANGTPELAAAAGTVIVAGPAGGFGQWVQIRHDDGTVTVYGHMDTIEVEVGQQVTAGELIATMGAQGNSTGPHLHFEVWPGGDRAQRIDPATWLGEHGVGLPEYTP